MFLRTLIFAFINSLCFPALCKGQIATKIPQSLSVTGFTTGHTAKKIITITTQTLNAGDYLEVSFPEFSVSDDFPSCSSRSVTVTTKEGLVT